MRKSRQYLKFLLDMATISFIIPVASLWIAWSFIYRGAYVYFFEPNSLILWIETIVFSVFLLNSFLMMKEKYEKFISSSNSSQSDE